VDVVLCHHTLEHLLHPATALQEMGRLLRPEGKLLLYVPFERERKYRRFDPTEPNHHLYSWNVQSLGNLAAESGFRVLAAGTRLFGYERFTAVWASKAGLGERGFRALRLLLLIMKPAREIWMAATHSGNQS
jgi:ubiquinone/menaquinone biosynthesis C-methylase UbiE